jgi:hypothetical protein
MLLTVFCLKNIIFTYFSQLEVPIRRMAKKRSDHTAYGRVWPHFYHCMYLYGERPGYEPGSSTVEIANPMVLKFYPKREKKKTKNKKKNFIKFAILWK